MNGDDRRRPAPAWAGGAVWCALLVCGGCALEPKGTDAERDKLKAEGVSYEARFEERALPELPESPAWRDVLGRAFLASGELEAAYFDWKAAIENVGIASAWPNSDVALGFSYMFSGGRMKSFDRMTFTAGFDSMKNLSWPGKSAQAGKVALDQARGAAERFRFVKFDVQEKVLTAWAEYTQRARAIAAYREELALLKMRVENEGVRAGSGAVTSEEELIAARLESTRAESDLKDMEAEQESARARLNTLLERDRRAELRAPTGPPELRPLPDDDEVLLKAAADIFPEVGVFAQEVEGRKDALELARMRWIPDVTPSVVFSGSVAQAVGAVVTLPTTIREIQGRINQAGAELRGAEAMLRQKKQDRTAEYVGLLVMLRNAQRQEKTLEEEILPLARELAQSRRRSYEAGLGGVSDLIEAERAVLDVGVAIARAEAAIEKAVVEIECCLGVDIETLPAEEKIHHRDTENTEKTGNKGAADLRG